MTFDANRVFIGVFSFRGRVPESMHALLHSLRPLLDFLGHVMQDWIEAWAALIDTGSKLSETLSSIVAYCQALLMAWPKQAPSNGTVCPNISQLTMILRACVIVPKFVPSSLT